MKKNILLWTIPAALLLAGCSQEELTEGKGQSGGGQQVTILATDGAKQDANTRTAMDEFGFVNWSAGDKIKVNGVSSDAGVLSADKSTATFTATVAGAGGSVYGFYPASMEATYNSDNHNYSVTLPEEQTYLNNTTFSPNENPSIGIGYREGEKNYKIGFHNLGGLLKVRINNKGAATTGIKKIRFTSTGKQFVSGAGFTADSKTYALTVPGNGSNKKTVKFSQDKTTEDGLVVYFVLPPATYTKGWKLELLGSNDFVLSSKTAQSDLLIKRSRITRTEVEFTKDAIILEMKNFDAASKMKQLPTKEEVERMLGYGVYWDDNGPSWIDPQTKQVKNYGVWIKAKNLGSGRRVSSTNVINSVPDNVRYHPDWIFLPQSTQFFNGGWQSYSKYWTSTTTTSGRGAIMTLTRNQANITEEERQFDLYVNWSAEHYKIGAYKDPSSSFGIPEEVVRKAFNHPLYWDTDGITWEDHEGNLRNTGMWMKVKNAGSPSSNTRRAFDRMDPSIRTNPDYIFLPAGGLFENGSRWLYVGERGQYMLSTANSSYYNVFEFYQAVTGAQLNRTANHIYSTPSWTFGPWADFVPSN